MKKLLDSNLFVIVLIALQILFLVAGVLVAIYDGGHASVALLILVAAFSVILNIILTLLAVVLKSSKKWYYIGLMLFWVLSSAPMLYDIFYAQYEYEHMEDEIEEMEMQQRMYEELQLDSIQLDSIHKGNP